MRILYIFHEANAQNIQNTHIHNEYILLHKSLTIN